MQIFVRGLQGGSFPLRVADSASAAELKTAVEVHTRVPGELHRLVFAGRDLGSAAPLSLYGLCDGATVQMALRLRGGKGGFGALLRGQGRDGKITTNFDACRDLTGRRLRHVNAEKKLEEWAGQSKERELEAIAVKHVNQLEREQSQERRKVDIGKIRQQQADTIDGVKTAVAVGLIRGSKEGPQKRAAEASSSKAPSGKKPKFYFPEDEGDDWLSSDADDSCNNQGSVLHSLDQNNDSGSSEENGVVDKKDELRHHRDEKTSGNCVALHEEGSGGGAGGSSSFQLN